MRARDNILAILNNDCSRLSSAYSCDKRREKPTQSKDLTIVNNINITIKVCPQKDKRLDIYAVRKESTFSIHA